MTTQLAFLRAVNLGKRTVKMSRCAEIFRDLGFDNVSTYINSGNVIFDATGSRASIEKKIEDALEAEFGFEVTTYVRTAAELRKAIAIEPFDLVEGDTYFITFLKAAPSAAVAKQLESLSNDFETLEVKGRDVHWLMHGKSTDSRLKKKDWKIADENHGTSRNTTMLHKLIDKASNQA